MDTYLLEFQLKREVVKEQKVDMIVELENLVQKFLTKSKPQKNLMEDGFLLVFAENSTKTVVIRCANNGILFVNVDSQDIDDASMKTTMKDFENAVRGLVFYKKKKIPPPLTLPAIKRGREFSQYDHISGQLVERDFDRVVFDDVSPYQHVRIMHSLQYGNVLFLDLDVNLSESDIEYTRAITGFDLEDYKDKTVLILGGGDGGILHYLQDRGPKMITMVDIDQMVIDAAKVHLRGICHDVFDQLPGSNYEVIIDDCVKHLKKFADEGKEFDYIINDLTAIPVSTEPIGQLWDFMREILSLSMRVLKHDGKYFTQGNSQLHPEALEMYDKQLMNLECSVKFEKQVVCVPSYLENWIFYKIWKDA